MATHAGLLAPVFFLFATSVSAFVCTGNTTTYTASTTYLGCWTDADVRTLSGRETIGASNSPQFCANTCGSLGYNYSIVEYTTQCFCGNSINPISSKANESSCTYVCPGNSSAICGGTYFGNLYQINNPLNVSDVASHRLPVCQTNPFCAQKACDTTLSIADRVKALLSAMTLSEKISNTIDGAAGVSRLGLPPYEWWNEALHGVAGSPGVSFASPNGSDFSYATSFPMPILMGAAFDDPLILSVASVVGKEARAFANYEHSGFDFWTPNINTFLDPRWGRGLEVPSEDSFHVASYVRNLIPGLQGGLTDLAQKQIIATCKHFAVYDVETNRMGADYNPTQQDLGEYYLAPFKTCVRDVGVGSVMCSYNSVDGIPACANEFLLDSVLRTHWNFSSPYSYVVSDCDAVGNIYSPHNFTSSNAAAAAVALNAGTDLDCGQTYLTLNQSIANNWTTEAQLDTSLTRLYTALFTVGYFDGQPKYDSLSWADVSTPSAQSLAYTAAVEGMTLLKNDGLLPVSPSKYSSVAVIGPWANATTQMQGNYEGTAPYLNSPLSAFTASFQKVNYAMGTAINTGSTSGFAAALSAAQNSDVVIYLGGIDTSIEAEARDRTSITWPGNQLDLISQLSAVGKPLVVVQFGGGQLDDSALLNNTKVNSLMWAGYPGQDGGPAVVDVLTGKQSVAGRLTTTQYPANYINEVNLFDPALRPHGSSPGRTYKYYTGKPVLPFGYGLSYTNFTFSWGAKPKTSYDISSLVNAQYGLPSTVDNKPFVTVDVTVSNTGTMASDYVALLFLSSTNAGPSPRPAKSLVAYTRAHGIAAGGSQKVSLPLTLSSLARADENGDLTIYPGDYRLALDIDGKLTADFTLTGSSAVVDALPRQSANYEFSVPVNIEAPTYSG